MVTKKPTGKPKEQKVKPKQGAPIVVTRPRTNDELLDEDMVVDASGTFRAVSAISRAQVGHDEDTSTRFPSESLVMQAQREGFREPGTTPTDVVDESVADDESAEALKRQRLATLAARNEARTRRR